MEDNLKVWASIGCTINLGNYESNKIEIGLTGVPINATDEYIQQLMPQAITTIQKVVENLGNEMTRMLQENYGR